MSHTLDFYYDFCSPNAYLAYKVLPALAARHSAQLVLHPVLLGGIFKATNNQSPIYTFADTPRKIAYMQLEIERFKTRHAVEFTMNPHFPVHGVALMRAATYAQGQPWEARLIETLFDATWQQGENTGDPAVIERVLEQADLPARDIMNATLDPQIKDRLRTNTEACIARGAFGLPSVFAGDAMFFGKDSLPDLEAFLNGQITR